MTTGPTALPADAVKQDLVRAMEGTVGVRNPPAAVLDGALQAARRAADLMRQPTGGLDEDGFARLAAGLPADLRAWLLELPSFLAKKGREGQGDELCDLFAPILGREYLEAERAVVRLEAGRRDDALAQAGRVREEFGEHPWVLLRGAWVAEKTGDKKAALAGYERAVERARELGLRKDLRCAFDGLVQFHQQQGHDALAVELSRRMLAELPEIEDEFRTEQVVNTAPKVGRNDPCPCGSGKKHKKCCGR